MRQKETGAATFQVHGGLLVTGAVLAGAGSLLGMAGWRRPARRALPVMCAADSSKLDLARWQFALTSIKPPAAHAARAARAAAEPRRRAGPGSARPAARPALPGRPVSLRPPLRRAERGVGPGPPCPVR